MATGVAVGSGNHVFGADFYNHRIQDFTGDGRFLTTVGEAGRGPGQLDRPTDLALASDGTASVVDFGNGRVQVFAPDAERAEQSTATRPTP